MTGIDTSGAGRQPAPAGLGREDGSSVYLAGQILAAIADALIELGDQALTATGVDGRPTLPVEDRQSGYVGGIRVGYTQMYDGKTTATLKPDDPALVRWALASDRYRHNVITVQMLAPAVVDELKKHAVKVGAPVDKHGELVPGLALKKGDPTPYKRLDKQILAELLAPERINQLAHALLAGTANLPGLSALPTAVPAEGSTP